MVCILYAKNGCKKAKAQILNVVVCKGHIGSGRTCLLCSLCKKDAHEKSKAQILKGIVCKGHVESLFSFI